MIRLVFALVLGCSLAARANAAPLHLLVLSGGTTEADAKKALGSFQRLQPVLEKGVTLAAGYPRVLESKTVPGLKPGFWIVALGACRDAKPALEAVKAAYPGAYARQLQDGAAAEACPALSRSAPAPLAEPLAVPGGAVSAAGVVEPEEDERGTDTTSTRLHFALAAKDGTVEHVLSIWGDTVSRVGDGPAGWEYERCTAKISREAAAFVVTRECRSERTGCEPGEKRIPRHYRETVRVAVKGGRVIESKPKVESVEADECLPGASGEGD